MASPRLFHAATNASAASAENKTTLESLSRLDADGEKAKLLVFLERNRIPGKLSQKSVRLPDGDWAIVALQNSQTKIFIINENLFRVKKAIHLLNCHYPQLQISSSGQLILFFEDATNGNWVVRAYENDYSHFHDRIIVEGHPSEKLIRQLHLSGNIPDYLNPERLTMRWTNYIPVQNTSLAMQIQIYALPDNMIAIGYDADHMGFIDLNKQDSRFDLIDTKKSPLFDSETGARRILDFTSNTPHVFPIQEASKRFQNKPGKQAIAYHSETNEVYEIDSPGTVKKVTALGLNQFATLEVNTVDRSSLSKIQAMTGELESKIEARDNAACVLRIHVLEEGQLKEINSVKLKKGMDILRYLPMGVLLLADKINNDLFAYDPLVVGSVPQKMNWNIENLDQVTSARIFYDKIAVSYTVKNQEGIFEAFVEMKKAAQWYQKQSVVADEKQGVLLSM